MKLKVTRYPGISSDRVGALFGYLNSLGGGRDPTPAADFYPHHAREDVAHLSLQMTDSALSTKPLLRAYEWTRLPKYGQQGGLPSYRDDKFQETIDRYWRVGRSCSPDCEALSELLKWFSTAELEPYSYAEVISRQRRNGPLKTSSGLPFLTEREKVIHDAIQLARANKHYPAILGMRAIRQGLRDIFMYDMGTNLQELSFVYAVMDWLIANTNAVAAWLGKQHVQEQMQQQFPSDEAVTHLSTDYSKMDTTVQEQQVKLGIQIITSMFKPKYRAEVSASLNALYSKPAVVAAVKKMGTSVTADRPGESPSWHFFITEGNHGLFSGSGWTNCLETVLSFCLMYQVTRGYQLLGFQVNGDDGEATVLGHHPHLDKEWTKAALEWGFDANVEKQELSYRTISYLQNKYDDIETRSGGVVRGSYPALLAVNSAKNPERWISIPNDKASDRQRAMEAVRLIAIGNNCAGNPAFDSIVKFFVQGSPTRCGLDLPDDVWTLTRKAQQILWEHGVATEAPELDEIDIQTSLHATPFYQRMMKLHMDGEL